jgi:hypothetical protein
MPEPSLSHGLPSYLNPYRIHEGGDDPLVFNYSPAWVERLLNLFMFHVLPTVILILAAILFWATGSGHLGEDLLPLPWITILLLLFPLYLARTSAPLELRFTGDSLVLKRRTFLLIGSLTRFSREDIDELLVRSFMLKGTVRMEILARTRQGSKTVILRFLTEDEESVSRIAHALSKRMEVPLKDS